MKYLITESQYQLLVESNANMWFIRRANEETLEPYIHNAEIDFPTLCDDFGDEFEYAENVIKVAVDDFMLANESHYQGEIYDDLFNTLTDMCKEWFGEYLFDIYRTTCEDNED